MKALQNILLASHDSIGAQAAEKYAFEHCSADNITHLVVIPDFWRGMLGDDWLNTSKTRRHFTHYLESTLTNEIDQHIKRLQELAKNKSLNYSTKIKTGDPIECLLSTINESKPIDLVVMGSQRPKGVSGLRSRMLDKKLLRRINVPLLVIPFPHD